MSFPDKPADGLARLPPNTPRQPLVTQLPANQNQPETPAPVKRNSQPPPAAVIAPKGSALDQLLAEHAQDEPAPESSKREEPVELRIRIFVRLHPYVEGIPELRAAAEKLVEQLAAFYQLVGRHAMEVE